jgi:hypothetical protein
MFGKKCTSAFKCFKNYKSLVIIFTAPLICAILPILIQTRVIQIYFLIVITKFILWLLGG